MPILVAKRLNKLFSGHCFVGGGVFSGLAVLDNFLIHPGNLLLELLYLSQCCLVLYLELLLLVFCITLQ